MCADGGSHDLVVQAGVAAAAAQDKGEVAAGFGEQVPSVEAAAFVARAAPRQSPSPAGAPG
ncbi:hypothetical protein [Streptomyces caniscabiei]|uniref:hypothetical protein n=1 Tax=Streptomyces caniscabiei TaxID=2746961 RepID=UPI001F167DB8|nr:hypothetical protein [Streptomyces caniscabiei]